MMWASLDPRGARAVAAWAGSTVCVYSALSSKQDKSNDNKEKNTDRRLHHLLRTEFFLVTATIINLFVRYILVVLPILDTF